MLGNGKNITIQTPTNINFAENAGITMNGGNFTCGSVADNAPQFNNFRSVTDRNTWQGLSLQNMNKVEIYKSVFKDVKYLPESPNPNYAVYMMNVSDFIINQTTFNMNYGAGAVNVTQYDPYMKVKNQLISYCNIDIPVSAINPSSAIYYISLSGLTYHFNLENNIIINNSSSQQPTVFLNGVTSGVIKSNTITNFLIGINSSNSESDYYGNIISSNVENAIGVSGNAVSEINMSPDTFKVKQ